MSIINEFPENIDKQSEPKGNILLIDDLPENLKLLTDSLSKLGYKIRSAISGNRGLKTAKLKPPDLILLDVKMPEMDGYEVCQAFKNDPDLCDLPILFISALDDTFDKLKAFQVGGVDYITKPIQIQEVVARVETHLTIQKQQRILQAEIVKRKEIELALKEANRQLQSANHQLKLLANLDGLTQIANRRRFDDYLTVEWQRHLREKQPLALILIDIDYFKRYNDHYGHQGGDDCLIKVAQTIAKIPQRPTDLVARYGGEEFAVILPHTNSEGALIVAEEIREAIANLSIPHQNSAISDRITLSMGIASEIPTGEQSLEVLISYADQALYTAKSQGRNQAIAYKIK